MRGILRLALGAHACGGSRAVVSVGDVERRNPGEDLRDAVVGLPVANHPEVVPETVFGRKVVVRSVVLHHVGHDRVDLGIVGVGEKDRLDVGPLVADVDHAVLLLVGTRELMLLDRPRKVILEVAAHSQTVLRAALHRLRINIVVLLGILLEPARGAPRPEVRDGLVVDPPAHARRRSDRSRFRV